MAEAKPNTLPPPDYLRECFALTPDGKLIWKPRPSSHFDDAGHSASHIAGRMNARDAGKEAGTLRSDGYVHVRLDGRLYLAHRIIWSMSNNHRLGNLEIDHLDRDTANNRPENLRPATRSENARNIGLRIDNTSGIRGVCWLKARMKWSARIKRDGKFIHIGDFTTKAEAAAARLAAEVRYHGRFAPIGDPSSCLIDKPKGGDASEPSQVSTGRSQEPATSPGVTAGASAQHASDCAVHNEPAYPKGPCNCGASTEELCKRSELAEAQCEKWAETASRQAERIDALTAEIERLRAPPKWRPIATAPKDGTHIILGCFETEFRERLGHIAIDYWHSIAVGNAYDGWGQFNQYHWPPTHWMPLPAAPVDGGEDA